MQRPFSFFLPVFLAFFGGVAFLCQEALASPGWEKIIDDGEAGYTETGSAWETWSHPEGYKGAYRYLSHKGQNLPRKGTATWQVAVPSDGIYEISVYFRQTANRTTDADYIVTDGAGKDHRFSLNQQTLPTGWHPLGRFTWAAGQIAKLVLDGTDDNQSDSADAARFKFISSSGTNPNPDPTNPCKAQGPGRYTATLYAGDVTASGDWASPAASKGPPDGVFTSSPNVDAGEIVTASGFAFCTPKEIHKLLQIRVAVLAKMQYESGPYHLILYLESEGKRFQFSQTALRWVYGDITATRAAWTFQDLQKLVLRVGLSSQPGGKRDSDAWIDAFAVEATYEISSALPQCPPTQILCGGVCIDPATHPQNCGLCNFLCSAAEVCKAGKCVFSCPPSQVSCSGVCRDTQADPQHCGICGNVCPPSYVCLSGACASACPSPLLLCGQGCIDPRTTIDHCGGCNVACDEQEVCLSGRCSPLCTPPKKPCSGGCVDIFLDPSHCGACQNPCPPSIPCTGGVCARPSEPSLEAPFDAGSEPSPDRFRTESPVSSEPWLESPSSAQEEALFESAAERPIVRRPGGAGCSCASLPSEGTPFFLWLLFAVIVALGGLGRREKADVLGRRMQVRASETNEGRRKRAETSKERLSLSR